VSGEPERGRRRALPQWLSMLGVRLGRAEPAREPDSSLPVDGRGGGPGETRPLPAIVLSSDRYHALASHMIMRYGIVWPSHPFTFHVPYQHEALPGARVVSRRTRVPIRATVLGLLEGFDDEAWVYWCIDDKYPVQLVQPLVERLAAAIQADELPGLDGLLFCRCRRLLLPEHLLAERRDGPDGVVLLRRKDYSQIWIHQFLRVKVLRQLFLRLPESIRQANEMDSMKDALALPPDHRLYVVETNLAVFGESTIRGLVTRNCAESLRSLGIGLPPGFEETDVETLMGSIAVSSEPSPVA
jgi:hypothetical protein